MSGELCCCIWEYTDSATVRSATSPDTKLRWLEEPVIDPANPKSNATPAMAMTNTVNNTSSKVSPRSSRARRIRGKRNLIGDCHFLNVVRLVTAPSP